MRLSLFCALALLLLPGLAAAQSNALLQGPALAPPPSAPSDASIGGGPTPVTRPADDRVAFDTAEQWYIPYYFTRVREKQKRAARNKRYDRALPAGLTQDPARGEQLSPAVLAQLPRLPGPLLRDLPPARPGTDRVIVGKNVLMVTLADGTVLDILPNVIF